MKLVLFVALPSFSDLISLLICCSSYLSSSPLNRHKSWDLTTDRGYISIKKVIDIPLVQYNCPAKLDGKLAIRTASPRKSELGLYWGRVRPGKIHPVPKIDRY